MHFGLILKGMIDGSRERHVFHSLCILLKIGLR
jgi:hypothetical protein